MMVSGLKDKVVLVTGASSGIGAATAVGFAQCGAHVAVHYNVNRKGAEDTAAKVEQQGVRAFLIEADVRNSEKARSCIARTVAEFGRLDVLVNNAGGMVKRVPPADVTDEIFDAIVDLNCRSVVMLNAAAIPVFRKQGHGNIINVSSIIARLGGAGGSGLYASAKGFVMTHTRNLARELAPDRIRVNQVAPGLIVTPFHDGGITSAETIKQIATTIPMGRAGTAEDLVGAFLYLASDDLSGYVTGQVIDVNGGQVMP